MTWNLPTTLDNIPDEDHQRQLQRQQVQQRQEYSSDFAFLHQLLFQHVVQQKNEGVPIQEIEKFLRDRRAVKSFFESRGCKFRARTTSRYFRIVDRQVVIDEDTSDDSSSSDSDEGNEEEASSINIKEGPVQQNEGELEEKNVSEQENDVDNNDNGEDTLNQAENETVEVAATSATFYNVFPWLKQRAILNLKKLVTITKYMLLLAVIMMIGHFGICHVLDVNPLKFFPNLMERRCLIPTHPILMEMTRPIADCAFCREDRGQQGNVSDDTRKWETVIEMMDVPTKELFAEVAYLSKPVIIRGGGKNGGMPNDFDFPKLKEIFQSEPGGVDAVSEECQFLPFRSPFTTLREAFEKIGENSDWEEPWYIGWSNCHPGVAAKLRKLFPRPNFLPADASSSAIDWIFIGSPGLGASMHIDYVKRPSWQAQLSGRKRWLLNPPPECESVCPESVTFTIYPGDLLFLETNTWYHQTFIEGDTFSISIGSEYD